MFSPRKQSKNDLDDIFAVKGKKSAPQVTTRATVTRKSSPNAPIDQAGFLSLLYSEFLVAERSCSC